MNEINAWLVGRLPEEWFDGEPDVAVDRDEIVVVGRIDRPGREDDASAQRSVEAGRIKRFREQTRQQRMQIAEEAESLFGRKVAWGATCGETTQVFTSMAMPVMTRLRQPERQVLDTLVDAGVARSRSEALGWCVRLVGQHQSDWIEQLRAALVGVEQARAAGPPG